jgi:GTP cyclohydrolase II
MRIHSFKMSTIADNSAVRRVACARMPTVYGDFRMHVYLDSDGDEHAVMVRGVVRGGVNIAVRIHSECLTGDVFGSCRCDCGEQLRKSLAHIAQAGAGVIIYMRGHEGRGIGLANKVRAYALQERGRDTAQANEDLGLPVDARCYDAAAGIIHSLGLRSVALITNNPDKLLALSSLGVTVVRRIELQSTVNTHNSSYLATKRDKLRHHLVFAEKQVTSSAG